MKHIAYIGIGSNLGDKLNYCEKAISEILKFDHHRLLAKSSFFKTEPVGYVSQDWFVNTAVKIETELEALELLRSLKTIEAQLGRTETIRWGPRTINLDILWSSFPSDLRCEHGSANDKGSSPNLVQPFSLGKL